MPCRWLDQRRSRRGGPSPPETRRLHGGLLVAAKRTDDRWGQAFLQQLNLTDTKQRLRLVDAALAAHPSADVACWFTLMRAQALLAGGSATEALDVIRPLTEEGSERQKYEAALLAADILAACNRHDEAREQLRLAEELARRDLYADPGVDPGIPAAKHASIGRSDEEKLWRDAESARGRRDFATALAGYTELAKRYPKSIWHDAAVVQTGWCLVSIGKVSDGESLWQSFIAANPPGLWRGRALLALVDAALESHGDPNLANERSRTLETALSLHQNITLEAPADPGDGWVGVAREAALRKILLLLIAGNHTEAKARAVSLLGDGNPADRARVFVTGSPWYNPASGVGKLLEALARDEPPTPVEAIVAGKDQANLHLLFADLFRLLELSDKAEAHLAIILSGSPPASELQKAYARMRQGDLAYTAGRLDAFRTAYRDCQEKSPRNPWAPQQLLVLAVDAYSRQGSEAEALKQFRELQTKFPNSHEAQSAGWYRGVIAYWAGRWIEADAAFTDLDRRYPGHEWSQLIRDHYRPRLRAAIEVDLPPTMDPAKVDLLPKSSSKNSKESSTESNQEPRP